MEYAVHCKFYFAVIMDEAVEYKIVSLKINIRSPLRVRQLHLISSKAHGVNTFRSCSKAPFCAICMLHIAILSKISFHVQMILFVRIPWTTLQSKVD